MINLTYIHFTDEQKQRAASVDLEAFLRSRGERLISSGRDKRLASDHSVTIRGNEWYDHAEEKGGTAISFVQRYYGIGYADAVQLVKKPVSYTHLDVYKRQVPSQAAARSTITLL